MKMCRECFWFEGLVDKMTACDSGFGRCTNPKTVLAVVEETRMTCNKTNYREGEAKKNEDTP